MIQRVDKSLIARRRCFFLLSKEGNIAKILRNQSCGKIMNYRIRKGGSRGIISRFLEEGEGGVSGTGRERDTGEDRGREGGERKTWGIE